MSKTNKRVITCADLLIVFAIFLFLKENKNIFKAFTKDYFIATKGGQQGIVDSKRNIFVPFNYDRLDRSVHQNYAISTKNKREGIVSFDGKVIIPPIFRQIESFEPQENYIVATRGYQQGIINLEGNTIVPFIYDEILDYSNKIALINQHGETSGIDEFGIVDRGQYISLTTDNSGNYFANGYAILYYSDRHHDRYCIIDRHGKILISARSTIPEKRKKINNLCKNIAGIKVNNSLVKKSKNSSKPISDREISYEESFSDDLLRVLINGEYGYVNLRGELVIPPKKFDEIGEFSEGLAAFVRGSKYGFVDRQGEVAFYLQPDLVSFSAANKVCSQYKDNFCQYQLDRYSEFKDGLAKVIRIDNQGRAAKPRCQAYKRSPLNYVYLDRRGEIVKEEPFEPVTEKDTVSVSEIYDNYCITPQIKYKRQYLKDRLNKKQPN